jgi:hypothetical protein
MRKFQSVEIFRNSNTGILATGLSAKYAIRRPTHLRVLQKVFLLSDIAFSFCWVAIRRPKVFVAQILLRRGSSMKGNYQWLRLFELDRVICFAKESSRENGSLRVLEFGSGASTLLIHTLIGKSGHLVSLEENEQYRNRVLSVAQKVKLKDLSKLSASLLLSQRVEEFDDEILISRYAQDALYESPFDLVYIDGPTSWIQNSQHFGVKTLDGLGNLPNADIVRLRRLPHIILLDGRKSTLCYILNKYFSNKYRISLASRYSFLWGKVSHPRHFHTIFVNEGIASKPKI